MINFKKLIAGLLLIIVPTVVGAITPYETTLGSNKGFIGASKKLSLTSGAAVKCPTLPAGAHEIWVISANAVNFGASSVASGTEEAFIATNTVQIFDKLITKTPEIYFIPRETDVATLTINFR